jgi:UDP-N-acetylglucosamine acyltransferase
MIHPTALVDPAARVGARVSIGAYSVIGADVQIGEGTTIGPHVVVEGPTRIGRDNRIFQFASIGAEAQDKKFGGERCELVIGDRNTIREFVTLNRGTGDGGGVTRIGDDNWFLAYTHVAHDCIVGNHCVFSNNATLAGHVEVGDHVIFPSPARTSSAASAPMPSSAWAHCSPATCRRS